MGASLVNLESIARTLNRTEDEILDLCGKGRIPHIVQDGILGQKRYVFPAEEVLAKIKPRETKPEPESEKKAPAKRGPKPKVRVKTK